MSRQQLIKNFRWLSLATTNNPKPTIGTRWQSSMPATSQEATVRQSEIVPESVRLFRKFSLEYYPLLSLASTLIFDGRTTTSIDTSTDFLKILSNQFANDAFVIQMNAMINGSTRWNQTLNHLRNICNYHPNFLRFLLHEQNENLSKFFEGIDTSESLRVFDRILAQYFQGYNYHLHGLLIKVITEMIYNSPGAYQDWMEQKNHIEKFDENLTLRLSDIYDLSAFGIHFHDAIPDSNNPQHQLASSDQKLTNLMVLMGDLCLAKTIVNSLDMENIQRCLAECHLAMTKGKFIPFRFQESQESNNYDNFDEIIENFDQIRPYESDDELILTKMLEKKNLLYSFLTYTYLTGGFQLGYRLKFSFERYGLSNDAQNLAFDIGQNLGTALNIHSQIMENDSCILSSVTDPFPGIPKMIKQKIMIHYATETQRQIDDKWRRNGLFSERSGLLFNSLEKLILQLRKPLISEIVTKS